MVLNPVLQRVLAIELILQGLNPDIQLLQQAKDELRLTKDRGRMDLLKLLIARLENEIQKQIFINGDSCS